MKSEGVIYKINTQNRVPMEKHLSHLALKQVAYQTRLHQPLTFTRWSSSLYTRFSPYFSRLSPNVHEIPLP